MAYKVKAGIFKGLKVFSRIFAVKEHEMEIGYPTDVKHVAHIGWDSAAGSASPSWMNDIMASSDLSSLGNFAALTGTSTSWVSVSQDLDSLQRVGAVAENTGTGRRDDSTTCPDVPRPPRKPATKKPRDGSPTALSASEPSSSSTDEVATTSPPSPAGHVEAAANAAR
ncbi:hypothetical protein BDA96_06G245900 [Sorghum bicolor]|uniref:CRIB domain-containing protein n=2 Tax=Sorghum bicolor TaxID=4558 RepID=A0A921UE57_SORBI|nr:CRIB domain-containing protein RIC10 [Sorghum bicolor]EES12896.1 hypothetical protein SORBI_3006G224000 [Sorghum bicolor]KAG0527590.1 hypothetical protein BDA96_06G245900 [Sorghum bicolor]|eukprot:XP_002448568.1 CRIB domain-containing protein RIC10 [Sorghum bicolor]